MVHMVNIVLEQTCWMSIIHGTFGVGGLVGTLAVLVVHAVSYGDVVFAVVLSTLR